MRTSTIVVSSAFLLAALSAAFPVEWESGLVARSADSANFLTGIEARTYDEEFASRDLSPDFHEETDYSNNRKSPSHHLRSFYEQPRSELTRRRDPPLPPGFPYVRSPGDYMRNLDRWDTRRQNQNQTPPPPTPPVRPTTPSSPPRSPRHRRAFYDLD